MIICKNCNFQFENTEFCPNCGTPVSTVSEQPIVEEVVAESVLDEVVDVNENADVVEVNDTILIDEPIVEEKPAVDPGLSLGNVSFILGLIALISGVVINCCIPCIGTTLSFACAVVGIVLSILATKNSKAAGFENKKAKTGLILSIVAIVVMTILGFISSIAFGSFAALDPELIEDLIYEFF